MIFTILILVFYALVFVASVIGIIYFIGKRREEKKKERDILNNDRL